LTGGVVPPAERHLIHRHPAGEPGAAHQLLPLARAGHRRRDQALRGGAVAQAAFVVPAPAPAAVVGRDAAAAIPARLDPEPGMLAGDPDRLGMLADAVVAATWLAGARLRSHGSRDSTTS
jgi:hypothetical protein